MAVAPYLNQPKMKQQQQRQMQQSQAPQGGGARPTAQMQTMDMPRTAAQPIAGMPPGWTPPTQSANINPYSGTGGAQQAMTNGMPKGGVSPVRPSTPPQPSTPAPRPSTPAPQWGMQPWNPTPPPPPSYPQGNPAGQGGAEKSFFGSEKNNWNNIFLPDAFKDNDAMTPNYISSVLPVAQFGQNAYQYRTDFDEAQRRWNAEFGMTSGQNQYQQQLSTRQQQAAEMQAQLAAQQWNQQFGHTQYMDTQGLDLSRQQIGNQFAMGMDQNQASRDVANIYGNANINQAHIAAGADRYGSDRQVEGAYAYADAQKHAANMGVNEAHIGAAANRYGSELTLQGQLGTANIYGGAQRYGSDSQLAGQRYMADQGLAEAGLYSGAQRFNTEAQERMNAAMMANNVQMANINAYGRSQAPQLNWARSWG